MSCTVGTLVASDKKEIHLARQSAAMPAKDVDYREEISRGMVALMETLRNCEGETYLPLLALLTPHVPQKMLSRVRKYGSCFEWNLGAGEMNPSKRFERIHSDTLARPSEGFSLRHYGFRLVLDRDA